MRTASEVEQALELARSGRSATEISRATGIPRGTVREWMAGRAPRSHDGGGLSDRCDSCGGRPHEFASLPASYAYLLGLYLGDGCISVHRRQVQRIRIHLDLRYPGIIAECKSAIQELLPSNRVHVAARGNGFTGSSEPTNVVVSAYSKAWSCLLPQYGPGPKHERPIVLERWQEELIGCDPGRFLRGLIHSDGCRFMNTGRRWRYPRYSFSNQSADIRQIFVAACGMLNLHCTHAPHTVYVSRMADVAVLDQHVGPKA